MGGFDHLDITAIIVAVIAALGTLTAVLLNRRTLIRVESKTDAAAENLATNHGKRPGEILETAARDAASAVTAARSAAAQATTTAQDQMRLLEVIDGRLHDVSKRVDAQGREVGEVRVHLRSLEGQQLAISGAVDDLGTASDLLTKRIGGIDDKFESHLDQVGPMTEEFTEVVSALRARGDLPEKREPGVARD